MSAVILLLLATIYYRYQHELMLSTHRLSMQLQSESYIPRLHHWIDAGSSQAFPIDLAYTTALYTNEGFRVEGNLQLPPRSMEQGIRKEGNYIHFVVTLTSYGIEGLSLVFETEDDGLWFRTFLRNIIIVGTLIFSIFIFIGFVLSKLFIRPMKEAVTLLDNFIKDTTHELNTPVSTIMNNIEMLNEQAFAQNQVRKIRRIAIAARTISTIYDDLTYLILHHDVAVADGPLNVTVLLRERLEYFKDRVEQKKLYLDLHLDDEVIQVIDRTKATRIIDNLLSNAVKYNQARGTISIKLNDKFLQVSDTGKGIDKAKVSRIFERYMRADKTVGGFGIGLNIVAMIVKEYGYRVEVQSAPREGTSFTIFWN